jgi:TolB-like protein/DNA-binding winged helix-turn-helix (wHTH) protein/Flp pilus assembly protein TadD
MDEEEQQASEPDLRAGFELGPWKVLPNQNRIEADGEAVHLEPKVMEVLCVLAREQGEVVSRNDLLEEVWAGTYVTDEVLSRAVSLLRSNLGDDSKNPEYIATVPKTGYRLIKPIVTVAAESLPVPAAGAEADFLIPPRRRRWLPHSIIAVLVLMLLFVTYLFREQAPPPPLDPLSPTLFEDLSDWFELIIRGDAAADQIVEIAVLPFDDLSEQAGNAFLSAGLTDELIISLGRLEGLKVVARSSSLSLRNRYEDVRAIGDILRVDAVVEGTVRRAGNQLRVSAQLSSTRDGFLLWSQTFDRDLGDLLQLQAEISADIVAALREKLDIAGLEPPVAVAAAPDMEAYQLYLNGRFLAKLRGESPLRRSIELYRQALELDPGFTRAQLALAKTLVLLPYYSAEDEEESFTRALEILEAVEIREPADAGMAEAIRGFIAFRRWQWQLAEEQFHKALLLAPNDPGIYVWYSQFLSVVGRNADALKAAEQARDLDGVSPVVLSRLAVAHLWNNDNVRAAEQFARGADLGFVNEANPAYLIFLLRTERFDEARQAIRQIYAAFGGDSNWLVDNIEAITRGGDRALRRDAVEAIADGLVFPRVQLGLWLYLDEPERVLEVVRGLSGHKKYLDLELIFAEEGRAFRESSEFSDLAEELDLEAFWESWRGPDE